jgi:DNA primase
MIPAKTVQEILDATRIEEVIEDFVTLRRRGSSLLGLCPFHGEKTPSFNVSPTKNIFKCFGCDKKGDAITFLKEHENLTYVEALRWLARKYNIHVEEVERTPEQIAEQQITEALYIVNDFGLKFYQDKLFDTDEGRNVALSYFRSRGLREETIRNFGLGYASENPKDALIQKARVEGQSMDLLKKLGLVNQAGDRDFFRARVMFPIHNLSGKVAAFAGRTMSSDKTIPKYINSPESEIYVKNKLLFGAFQARQAIRKKDECILTEGYMDVISLHQAGIENVVASSGTSLTEGQLQLIKRNTDNLKILYDGDAAGIKAALRGLDLALEQDLNVKIALLPDGHDPDSYVQKEGSEAFLAYVDKNAKDFILFKTNLLLEETKGDPIKKSTLVKDIVGSIAKIPDPIKRSLYLKECAALMALPENILHEETNKLITATLKKRQDKEARTPRAATDSAPPHGGFDDGWIPPSEDYSGAFPMDAGFYDQPYAPSAPPKEKPLQRSDSFQERDIARLLVNSGASMLEKDKISVAEYILTELEETLDDFENPQIGRLVKSCYEHLLAEKTCDRNFFIQNENAEIRDLAIDLMTEQFEFSPNWIERHNLPLQNGPMPDLNFDLDMRQSIDRFKLVKIDKLRIINRLRIKEAGESNNFDEMMRFGKIQQKLEQTRNEIAKRNGAVVIK